MKKKLYLIFLVCCSVLFNCQPGDQAVSDEGAGMNPDEQIALVKKTSEELNDGLFNKNRELLDRICAEGLSYGHSSNVIQDKQEFLDDVMNGPFVFLKLEMEDQKIELFEDLAIERHIFDAKGINNGDTVLVRIGTAHLYKLYKNGTCKLVMRQGFKL